jgi:hypothetical protein
VNDERSDSHVKEHLTWRLPDVQGLTIGQLRALNADALRDATRRVQEEALQPTRLKATCSNAQLGDPNLVDRDERKTGG